ncbi:MAG: thioredoxin family protein [Clostridiaceae bacterium]|nr:thioredoxin family protein [Clostridiaceae bacterium]
MEIVTLTNENFESEVLQAEGPVLVEFWAPWCIFCRRLSPVLDRLAEKEDFIPIKKINVDDLPELEDQYDVRVIPTLMVFQKGEPGERLIAPGSQSRVEKFVTEEIQAVTEETETKE